MSKWISVRKKLPKDYRQYLCYLSMNDMGNHSHWFDVLYYDFNKDKWCKANPSSCNLSEEDYLTNWHSVTHWMPLKEYPSDE
jgi:hypothetical protein